MNLNVSGTSCTYYMVAEADVGYVVLMDSHGALDFGQCMCCHSDVHQKLGEAIRAKRKGLRLNKIIICGTDSHYNSALGVDATFSDFTREERDAIKDKATDLMGVRWRRLVHAGEVSRLIRELRYEDARMHCAVCGLDFENFLEEARKRLNPTKIS